MLYSNYPADSRSAFKQLMSYARKCDFEQCIVLLKIAKVMLEDAGRQTTSVSRTTAHDEISIDNLALDTSIDRFLYLDVNCIEPATQSSQDASESEQLLIKAAHALRVAKGHVSIPMLMDSVAPVSSWDVELYQRCGKAISMLQ
jgi:hypothetical protein